MKRLLGCRDCPNWSSYQRLSVPMVRTGTWLQNFPWRTFLHFHPIRLFFRRTLACHFAWKDIQNIQTSDTHRNPPCRNLGMLVAFYFVGKCWMPIRCNMLSGGFLWSFDGAKQVGSWPGRGLSMPGWLRILDTLVEGWWGTISWKKDLRKSWNDQTLYYIMYV